VTIASKVDGEYAQEAELAARLERLPSKSLKECLTRLESHVAALEKWIDVARIICLLGPAAVVLVNLGYFKLPVPVHDYVQIVVSAAVVGVLFGAVQLRSGLLPFQRVGFALKIALERADTRKALRKISRKRNGT
jgi:hypothetical protein